MNQDRDSRLPAGLIWLLIYQWILVLHSLGGTVGAVVGLVDIVSRPFAPVDVAVVSGAILVLGGWTALMIVASVGIARWSSRAFLLGMIGHAILEVPGLLGVCGLGGMFLLGTVSASESERAWAPLFLVFAAMWLPFVLLSGWAFFYLRRLRASGTSSDSA